MTETCELFERCGFVKKYNNSNNAVCETLIARYCKGLKMEQCKRKEHLDAHGCPPSEDMLPDGGTVNSQADL